MRRNNTTKSKELGISQRTLAYEVNMDCAEVFRI